MIECKLMGGLGNQLFQYAFAFHLASQMNDTLYLETGYYGDRQPSICCFNLKYDQTDTCNSTRLIRKRKVYRIFQRLIRVINRDKIGSGVYYHCIRNGLYFNFDSYYYPLRKSGKKDNHIYGYFQSESYFLEVSEKIKEQYTLKKPLSVTALQLLSEIENGNTVAIHIRLGDYLKPRNRFLHVCTDRYYQKAISYIYDRIQNPRFIIFTNDIAAVKQKPYIPDGSVFVDGISDAEALILMSKCKHYILSNSTFSWWGSYLSDRTDKIVVAPDKWKRNQRNSIGIYRNDMVKISCR